MTILGSDAAVGIGGEAIAVLSAALWAIAQQAARFSEGVSMRRLLISVCLLTSAASPLRAADHTLLATPQSVEWGYYNSEAKPVLTRALGRYRAHPDHIDLRVARGPAQAGREAGADPTLHRLDLPGDAEGRGPRRAHLDGSRRDRRGRARGRARGADPQGRHRCRLCLQRLLSRLRLPADGISLYPQQDHPARSQAE